MVGKIKTLESGHKVTIPIRINNTPIAVNGVTEGKCGSSLQLHTVLIVVLYELIVVLYESAALWAVCRWTSSQP